MTRDPLRPGAGLGPHYIVEATIGEGGMGVVYRARDTRLGRSVALKVLSGAPMGNPDSLRRFEQEARTASSLNHPNIVTIHEIGEVDGVHFIAQELVAGETLRHRLTTRKMTIGEAVDVAIQVAGALDAAHAAGVVHRDIKPENIMLRPDGYAKVLDFGVAKLARPDGAADSATIEQLHTLPGSVVGTVRYMSPEQARGLAVDGRSDVFSLGIVLYEMIAGRAPFDGHTSTDLLVAILSHEAAPLGMATPGVPLELERVVAKALRKSPDERYQGVKDLLVDLKATQTTPSLATGPAPRSPSASRSLALAGIAGLVVVAAIFAGFRFLVRDTALTSKDTILLADFTNSTGDSTFDGGTLKQALTVQLQQTPFLNLVPDQAVRTTLLMMERQPDERVTGAVAREICQRQGLKAMVSGTIARLGQHYVITLETVNAQSGATIAIQQSEAPDVEHVLSALGAAATGLREKLGETLGTLQKYNAPIEQATTSSLEALKAYSAAMALFQREDGRGALPFFARAVELDPNFVAAYDNGAWARAMSGNPGAAQLATEAFRNRERATELERLSAMATYHHFATGDWDEENRVSDVWAGLFPNDWNPHASHTFNYPMIGRLEDAAEAARTVVRLSPNIAQGYRFLATALVPMQRYDEAQRAIDQSRARRLDNVFLRHSQLAIALALNDSGKVDQAIDALRRSDGDTVALTWRARLAVYQGRWREGRTLYQQAQPAGPPTATRSAPLPLEALAAEALFGLCRPDENARALALSRIAAAGSPYAPVIAPDGSLCGDPAEADRFAEELANRFPSSTVSREISLPQLRAAAALKRSQPDQAIEALRSVRAVGPCAPGICGSDTFRAYYLRGAAYLRLEKGGEAASAFQTILDHRGWGPASPLFPLAHLGLARASSLAGDLSRARKAYEDLFAVWKSADADLPVLVEARKEYASVILRR
jgi:serine/threonine protein kinase/thioredoxin-like negative regulator of GroEL